MTGDNEILMTEERDDIYIMDMLKSVVFRHKEIDHILLLGCGDMEIV